jgi:hypothetical protein
LIRNQGCFRASTGDWFKKILEGNGEEVRVITPRQIFHGNSPPTLTKALILPVENKQGYDPSEDERSKAVLPNVLNQRGLHLAAGDIIPTDSHTYVVVNVEPDTGGLIDSRVTELFFAGPIVKIADKVRFAPMFGRASDEQRASFLSFLSRVAGKLFLGGLNTLVIDDNSQEWSVLEIRNYHIDEERGRILSPSAYVSVEWNPERRAATECLHCLRQVVAPAPDFQDFAFGCPSCGYLVPNPAYSAWLELSRARNGPARQLLIRLCTALSEVDSRDPRTIILGSLISRLPRSINGTLDWDALDEVALRVLQQPVPQINSTPKEILERLPTSIYVKASNDSEEDRCEICLDSYSEGATLRTLPCFHRFHVHCCDNWLALSKACPICKTEVDLEQNLELLI